MQHHSPSLSMFQPLRHRLFRKLWLANLLSNVGSWVQAFAAGWLIASSSRSPLATSLVQTASWAPMLLFALPAGVLADAMPRARLLFRINAIMALAACATALLARGGALSAAVMLLLTFVMGTGAAFMMPAWQASMSALVDPGETEAAATLNNLSYNLAALMGPWLGAVLFDRMGAAALFAVNACSFAGLLWIYRQWAMGEPDLAPAKLRILPAFRTGIDAARQSGAYRQLLYRAGGIFFASIAFAALLPLLVRDVLHLNAASFGTLMGCLGAGAVLAAPLLPALRRRLARRTLLAAALAVYGGMLAAAGWTSCWPLLLVFVAAGGMAWAAIVTTLNGAAQSAFPSALRARTLSIYILMVAAGQTAGSALWGLLAGPLGVRLTLTFAGAMMLLCALSVALSDHFLENQ